MTSRVTAALMVVRFVAERLDPSDPIAVGAIASELGMSLSSASRLCSELEGEGMLERGGAYGSYRLGRYAIRLSGMAAAPYARMLRFVTTFAAQQTGETVCLVAPSRSGMTVVQSVMSTWTLHSPARVGEIVADERSAIVIAGRLLDSEAEAEEGARQSVIESIIGKSVEIATPVRSPSGECVAVLAIRLPLNRIEQNGARARRAVLVARRHVETLLADELSAPRLPPDAQSQVTGAMGAAPNVVAGSPSAVSAALRILSHLAAGPDSIAGTARATGLRHDRVSRLVKSCVGWGFVSAVADGGRYQLAWMIHGWHRSVAAPLLVAQGKPLVAETANRSRTCAFITVLAGMRSLTLVEELEMAGEGLEMISWLGRAHPIVGSDGGPTLLMDLDDGELRQLFPARYTAHELATFARSVRTVAAHGVLSMQAFEDAGLISISAPIRDSSGAVAAAVCLVGTTDYMQANRREFERETRELAGRVSALLC
ncbi:helix-turn-helix domain-containing protein [Agreia sp. PsM10]|uniref:IclR family transcriptional regulator domain-containing protein n=1 Tax=Agreia sp. PsM10 TaxID=3030533 RepID=UPI00263B5725|nr:helix-turn-helix domain-containing protein [Agreia sp. PsM10]MDN4640722.1 helix-turn-helix domain-containing protein [Agreia sp. PsM10]